MCEIFWLLEVGRKKGMLLNRLHAVRTLEKKLTLTYRKYICEEFQAEKHIVT